MDKRYKKVVGCKRRKKKVSMSKSRSGNMKMGMEWISKSKKLRKLNKIIKMKINVKIRLVDVMENREGAVCKFYNLHL